MPDWGNLQVDQLRYMARAHGSETAYRDLDAGTSLTFSEWDAASNRLARGLVDAGIEAGDRVSIYLPGDEALRWIVAYAAVHKAGAVAVPTNTRLSVPELNSILGHAAVAAVLTAGDLLDNAIAVRANTPSIRFIVSPGATDLAGAGIVDEEQFLPRDASDLQVPRSLDDLADIMYTSGTTGAPMFTFAGIAFIYNPMKMGLVGLYLPKFDAGRWLDIVEAERPAMAFLVPAMAELLVAHPRFSEPDLTGLASVSIGSAPLAPQTLLTLQSRLPNATVSNSYGMTEAGPAFIVMPKDEVTKRIGSVGKPVGAMQLKIVRDDDTECDPREVGELLTKMEGAQREYYNDPEATQSTWTADGWLRSGDLAYLDEDGFLYIAGRKKDMIIRGGHNVYPTDVEAVLLEHPDVQEAAVVGIPHPVLGEDIAAHVVVRSGVTLDPEALLSFCAERLADYKRPRTLVFADELPRNATGKVMKHKLRSE